MDVDQVTDVVIDGPERCNGGLCPGRSALCKEIGGNQERQIGAVGGPFLARLLEFKAGAPLNCYTKV